MGDKTNIEWTDATWNPVTGCTKVSAGCKNCYAERDWARLSANPKTVYYGRAFTDVQCHSERIDQPLRWSKPRRIFVNSMSDLFHEDVPDAFIDNVFAVIALSPQHLFQVLTKRTKRMLGYMSDGGRFSDILNIVRNSELGYMAHGNKLPPQSWPLRNVHLGVSVENQESANERIPLLLQTPAAVRWVSAEPLLGKVDLSKFMGRYNEHFGDLDWVVVGGESGTNKHVRYTQPDWIRSLRDQCHGASIPFLFKQWGSRNEYGIRVGVKNSGRQLDGMIHDGYPA